MKQLIKFRIASRIPLAILNKLMRTEFIIPYYHMVSDNEIIHIKHLYKHKKIKQFKEDLCFLLDTFHPLSLYDLLNSLRQHQKIDNNSFLLTFDDGFSEMFDIVAPILLEKGVPATFFINSAFIDNKTLCYQHKASILVEHLYKINSSSINEKIKGILSTNSIKFNDIKSSILSLTYQKKSIIDEIAQIADMDFDNYLLLHKPYLTSDQIRNMIANGFTIGAHSIDHPVYSSLSLQDQLYQTKESIKFIKEKYCLNYGAFAFPHHDHNVSKDFFTEIYKNDFVDVSFGTSGIIDDMFPRNIQRFSLEKPLISSKRIIAYEFARRLFKNIRGDDRTIIRK